MYLEENICRAAECDYIDSHQTKLMLLCANRLLTRALRKRR